MADSFFDKVVSIIARLPDTSAFRESERGEDLQNFGNAYVVYEASLMKLRFVKDRGEISIDIAVPLQQDWWTLSQLCEVLGKSVPALNLESNTEALLLNYREFMDALMPSALSRTTEAIGALAHTKYTAMLARYGVKDDSRANQ